MSTLQTLRLLSYSVSGLIYLPVSSDVCCPVRLAALCLGLGSCRTRKWGLSFFLQLSLGSDSFSALPPFFWSASLCSTTFKTPSFFSGEGHICCNHTPFFLSFPSRRKCFFLFFECPFPCCPFFLNMSHTSSIPHILPNTRSPFSFLPPSPEPHRRQSLADLFFSCFFYLSPLGASPPSPVKHPFFPLQSMFVLI